MSTGNPTFGAPSSESSLEAKNKKLLDLKQKFGQLNEKQQEEIFKTLLPQVEEEIREAIQREWNRAQESASHDQFDGSRSGWTTNVSYGEDINSGKYDADLLKNLSQFENLLTTKS